MELLSSPKRSYDFIVRLNGLSLFDMQNIGIFNNNWKILVGEARGKYYDRSRIRTFDSDWTWK